MAQPCSDGPREPVAKSRKELFGTPRIPGVHIGSDTDGSCRIRVMTADVPLGRDPRRVATPGYAVKRTPDPLLDSHQTEGHDRSVLAERMVAGLHEVLVAASTMRR